MTFVADCVIITLFCPIVCVCPSLLVRQQPGREESRVSNALELCGGSVVPCSASQC